MEDGLCRFKPDAFVGAVEQLAQTLYCARGQLTQRSPDHLWYTGSAARIGTAARQLVSAFIAFRQKNLQNHFADNRTVLKGQVNCTLDKQPGELGRSFVCLKQCRFATIFRPVMAGS